MQRSKKAIDKYDCPFDYQIRPCIRAQLVSLRRHARLSYTQLCRPGDLYATAADDGSSAAKDRWSIRAGTESGVGSLFSVHRTNRSVCTAFNRARYYQFKLIATLSLSLACTRVL